jgi:hypothetical protein
MIVNKAVMAHIIAHGLPTSGVVVYEPEPPKEHRFYGKDLSNKASHPAKSSYNVKQRKHKGKRKSRSNGK